MSGELRSYSAKRNFSKTSEPPGRARKSANTELLFVVQKHAARRLHYDLRLELDGTLKSWAVTKGPSLVPGEKRLAVHVEDHPFDYANFEGNIPHGQYGAGSVIVWDRGLWLPEGDPHKGLAKGHLAFTLDGSKLRGRWHLVRLRKKPREKQESWLLIKSDDDAARGAADPDILEDSPDSVISNRSIETVARAKSDLPPFTEPCLAKISEKPPSGKNWIHEIKFDGYRIQVRKSGNRIAFLTRSGLDWTDKFGSLAKAFDIIAADTAVIDGELVVEDANGVPSFSALQAALRDNHVGDFRYYAFDALFRDGKDLRDLSLLKRAAQLRQMLADLRDDSPIRISEHLKANGAEVLEHACRMGLEGIVSKRIDRRYRSGRGPDWIKTKCTLRQEFVVIGFSQSTTSRRAIGALALAQYENSKLVYRGRIGTGFSEQETYDLFQLLDPLRRTTTPLPRKPDEESRRGLRWVDPEIVIEVEFRTWTQGGLIRHAVYRGLREDKPARDVSREASVAPVRTMPEIDESRFTHPERLLWPDAGVTKLGLAQFYSAIWPWIEPHIVGRPLSLLRCPEGINETCFFQKHAWAGLDQTVHRFRPKGDKQDSLYIESLDGLLSLVQSSVLEIHPWGAAVDDVDTADRLIFDLDPGPGTQWTDVIEGALRVRDVLDTKGLQSFVKTTGGKGLHVVVPLNPGSDWDTAKDFCHGVANELARKHPAQYTASLTKKHRNKRIFIDYLRNGRGATAVAAFSTRARAGAPVSTPLAWDELSAEVGPAHYTVSNLISRLDHLSADPWAGFLELRQKLAQSPQKAEPRSSKRRARITSSGKARKTGT